MKLKEFFNLKARIKKVEDMKIKGKNIYKNIKGHEKQVNYKIYDLPKTISKLKKLSVSITVLFPGKVNKEYKMTVGHSHKKAEEVYLFLEGSGKMQIRKRLTLVKKNDVLTVPKETWHRVINTGKKKLIFLSIFEKIGEEERGISKSS